MLRDVLIAAFLWGFCSYLVSISVVKISYNNAFFIHGLIATIILLIYRYFNKKKIILNSSFKNPVFLLPFITLINIFLTYFGLNKFNSQTLILTVITSGFTILFYPFISQIKYGFKFNKKFFFSLFVICLGIYGLNKSVIYG
ncbi:hypothetical protein CPAV1605_246 [seawater metagenome]|uniref:EamA domain-containing protein n=1 Tax=seawater metagenome TaxID=1561972 RepID=A0A5E8CH50_9ZZZZ